MKKSLVTVALAAVSALILSACNGTTASGPQGIAPLPNVGMRGVHHNDNSSADLHAGGADFPAYAYNLAVQPVGYYYDSQPGPGAGSLFYSAPTTGGIYYCSTGSTDGRKAFEGSGDSGFPPTGACAQAGQTPTGFGGRQDPLDFVGSSTAMSSTDYTSYKSVREPKSGTSWGEPFEFPEIGGIIALPYRTADFTVSSVKLSTWTYCAIANGTVSDWNDPAITKDNGKSVTGGNSESITFFFRSDSGGTTYNFENHLNTACNGTWSPPYNKSPYESGSHSAAWSFGVSSSWVGPGSSKDPNQNFVGENGALGILAAVESTAFSTGYLEGAYAQAAGSSIGQAELQNGMKGTKPIWVSATNKVATTKAFAKITSADIQYGEGSDEQPLGTSAPWCVLYIDPKYFVSPPPRTYPIAAISYLLFYGQNNGVHTSDKVKLIQYLESTKAQKIVNKFEYTSLNLSIIKATLSALKGNGGSQPACVQ